MDHRRDDDPLVPGDPMRGDDPLPPPPEPPPLPEQPLGPPSMADDPADVPPAQPPPAQPPPGYPPPGQAPPAYPPPGQAPPAYPPPAQPPPAPSPPGQAPPVYPPPAQPPPAYPPPAYQPSPYPAPPYQPPAPAQRGPHGEPVFRGMEAASWGSRVGAVLLDWLFAIVVPVLIGIPLAASGVAALEVVGAVLIVGAIVIGWPLYAAATEARSGEHAGQTIGKQIVGIRVVRDRGEPIGFGFALLRELLVRWGLIGIVGGMFFLPPILNILWPLWDESNRALHDMIVSTHVVRADAPSRAATAGLEG